MRYLILFLAVYHTTEICAQQNSLKGFVFNDQGEAVEFATVALLSPADSTLENFSFSTADGSFEIKHVAPADYILQISFVGLATFDTLIRFPLLFTEPAIYVLRTEDKLLDEVNVSAERTPILIKGDTIEYNAAAFKTQPDASAEDLLKKLPGVQVDEAGNIKAQGEDISQVLVDGKEFFSNDPAVATKNLPADAIEKVQVYDKSSDEAEFTGIDDGSRSKTINLMLKDGKKSMWMGNAQAGLGTEGHYQANAKLYRFTKENQIAALGMLNNINQFGFSLNDYIDFGGGIGALMSGGGFRIETGNGQDAPINFGQNMEGLITSGAAGLNFTREVVPGNRYNVSYLGNGYQKLLMQASETRNFLPGFNYATFDTTDESTENFYHRLNFNLRNKPDSMQSIVLTGGVSFNTGEQSVGLLTENYSSDSLTSALNSLNFSESDHIAGNASLNYIHKTTSHWPYFKINAGVSGNSTLNKQSWNNITHFYNDENVPGDTSFQHNHNSRINYNLQFSGVRKFENGYYLEPFISGGGANELYARTQGDAANPEIEIDSVSPEFNRSYYWIKPGLIFRFNTKSTQFRLSLNGMHSSLHAELNNELLPTSSFFYFTPSLSFEKEIKNGRHIMTGFNNSVTAPTAIQLMPVPDYINPLSVYTGNSELIPEYKSEIYFNWFLFDQFSFTSVFTNLNFQYTFNKINYSKAINEDLSEEITLVNTPYDFTLWGGFDFSTPLRPLKLNVRLDFQETFNRGINYINEVENRIDAFTYDVSLGFDNRTKELVDIEFGTSIKYTKAVYSIDADQSSKYFTASWFAGFDFTPTEKWKLSFNADIDRYVTSGFNGAQTIPLLKAGLSRYVLESNRGMITFKVEDILDQNSRINQVAAYNYIRTTTSNSIGRYFMVSFKYRINKAEEKNNVEIKVD